MASSSNSLASCTTTQGMFAQSSALAIKHCPPWHWEMLVACDKILCFTEGSLPSSLM